MRILIVHASRHGGTEGIAEVIGAVLRDWVTDGDLWEVDVVAAGDIDDSADSVDSVDVGRYDAVLLGSAVYVGHWLDAAWRFARHQGTALSRLPLWLFSSGPVGDPAVPAGDAVEAALLTDRLGARAHRTFAGRLRSADLSLDERATVRPVHASEGDFRDWPAIRAWARDIAETLTDSQMSAGTTHGS